jgi:hypothetical protein
MIKNVERFLVNYPLFLSEFNETWISSIVFFKKNVKISNLLKILSVEAELFCVDSRTDRHDAAKRRFSQFCESA